LILKLISNGNKQGLLLRSENFGFFSHRVVLSFIAHPNEQWSILPHSSQSQNRTESPSIVDSLKAGADVVDCVLIIPLNEGVTSSKLGFAISKSFGSLRVHLHQVCGYVRGYDALYRLALTLSHIPSNFERYIRLFICFVCFSSKERRK